ncbi:hypothetical protein FKP32DRAFT_1429215 [Trametes sanguinea]|nr:hypothetical protein FKP32DRAFT_1429215 [Trametes sanguinea]
MDCTYAKLAASLTNLSSYEEIASVRRRLMEHSDTVVGEARKVSSLLNSRAPINRLPAEVLVDIFAYVRSPDDYRYLHRCSGSRCLHPGRRSFALFRIMAVCRAWRAVACGDPSFWRDVRIGFGAPEELLQLHLQHSAPVPFNVKLVRIGRRDLPRFLYNIRNHSLRLAKLSLRLVLDDRVADVLQTFCDKAEMSGLLDLNITIDIRKADKDEEVDEDAAYLDARHGYLEMHHNLSPLSLHFRPDHFPHLTHLSVRNVTLRTPRALNPTRLATVTLVNRLRRPATVPLSEFAAFLNSCKELQHITLERLPFTLNSNARIPFRTVCSPSLRSLIIEDTSSQAKTLLGMFQSIPPAANVYVKKAYASQSLPSAAGRVRSIPELPAEDFWSNCLPWDKRGLPVFTLLKRIVTDYTPDAYGRISCKALVGRSFFALACRERDTRNIVLSIKNAFQDSPISELLLMDVPPGAIDVGDWIQLLRAFPSLRQLTVLDSVSEPGTYHACSTAASYLRLTSALARSDVLLACPHWDHLFVAIAARVEDLDVLERTFSELTTCYENGLGNIPRICVGLQPPECYQGPSHSENCDELVCSTSRWHIDVFDRVKTLLTVTPLPQFMHVVEYSHEKDRWDLRSWSDGTITLQAGNDEDESDA